MSDKVRLGEKMRYVLSTIVLIQLLTLLNVVAEVSENIKQIDEQAERAVLKNGVEMTVQVNKNNIVSQPLAMKISLTNLSDETISHGHIRGYDDYDVVVLDSFGMQVPLTRYGKNCVASKEGGKLAIADLQPGWMYSITLNLQRLFDLTIPGKYQVSISKRINPFRPLEYVIDVPDLEFFVLEETIVYTKTRDDKGRVLTGDK